MNQRSKLWFYGAILLAMVAGYALFMASTFLNFPQGDDFAILIPMGELAQKDGLGALSWSNLSSTYFVHRSVTIRAVGALQVLLTGQLEFGVLRLFGLFCVCLFFLIFCAVLSARPNYPLWLLPLFGLVFLQPQTYGSYVMGIQGPLHTLTVACFLSFWLRSLGATPSWVGAWFFAILAVFGAGNGLLVPFLLVSWDLWERRWCRSFVSVALFAAILAVYFDGYEAQTHHKHAFVAGHVLPGALIMLGGIFKFGWAPLWVPMVGGAVLLLMALWSGWLAYRRKDGLLLASLLFVLGSVAMAAVGRAGWGLEYMLQPRYPIWGLLLVLFSLAVLAPLIARSRLVSAGVYVAAGLFAVFAWWFYAPPALSVKRNLEASALSWQLGEPAVQGWSDAYVTRGLNSLSKAIKLGIYELPMRKKSETLRAANWRLIPADDIQIRFSEASAGYIASVKDRSLGRYVVFREDGAQGVRVAAELVLRPSLRTLLGGRAAPASGTYILPRADTSIEIPQGEFFSVTAED
jgi:hypothetical protein